MILSPVRSALSSLHKNELMGFGRVRFAAGRCLAGAKEHIAAASLIPGPAACPERGLQCPARAACHR
jgi:hypothetical protein